MATLTIVQAVRDALYTEMKRDPRVVLMGEDVGHNGGVFRATEGLHAEFGERQSDGYSACRKRHHRNGFGNGGQRS